MAMAGDDKPFIEFAHVGAPISGENNSGSQFITVLDPYAEGGHVTAVHRLPQVGSAACASSPYDFLFHRNERRQ